MSSGGDADKTLDTANLAAPGAVTARPEGGGRIGEAVGESVGPYKILQALGEGGFGMVWLAERREPFVQRVALKILKPGMDSKAVIARFEQERQALAVMDHPSVAKVHDAGTTPTGRPYFVMELVVGEPINTYCDRHKLTIRDRLELFLPVCDAVQHAHMKGIIHRDLKPANILVAVHGDKTIPKVIDFGIAKAISKSLTDKTIFTESGQLIGTPEYMSPEQAEMRGSDIDTRADVYSLGVVLYELVSGSLPFDAEKLRGAGIGELQRIIRDQEPPKPSTRVTNLGADASTVIAAQRRMERAELVTALRREIDWILMRAMEKDRTRRYSSASEFAADLRRFLKNEPVMAGPPGTSYRMKKFVVRHKLGVTAAGLVVAAVAMGIVGTSLALVRAVRAEGLAKSEAARANRQAQVSEESLRFLVGLFAVVDPSEARGNSVTAREILDKGAARIEAQLSGQPEAQATLMMTMGTVYRSLGLYDAAEPLYQKALNQRRTLFAGPRGEVAEVLNGYATLLVKKAKYDAAEPLYREALEMRRAVFGEEHPAVAESLHDLAYLLNQKGDFAGAEPMYRKALDQRRRLVGAESKEVADTLNNLAMVLFDKGDAEAPLPLLRDALAKRKKLFGEVHPDVAESLNSLAMVLYNRGDTDEALPLFREAFDVQKRLVGEVHPDVVMAMNNLAVVLNDSGKYDDAEAIYRQILTVQRKLLGEVHPDIAMVLNNLATVLGDKKDYKGAAKLARESLAMYRRVDGEEHPDVAQGMNNLARWLQESGEAAEAESMFRGALAMRRKLLGEKHGAVATSMTGLANLLVDTGRFDEALTIATEARSKCAAAFSDDHWRTAVADGVVGAAMSGLRRFDEAEPLLLKSYQALQKERGARIYMSDARRRLAVLYEAWSKPELAAKYRAPVAAGPAAAK